MSKKIALAFLLGKICFASSYVFAGFMDNTLSVSGEIGYTQFNNPSDRTLIISNYLTDLLTNSKQSHNASYSFGAKQQFNLNYGGLNKIGLGPTLYFQQAHYTGQVWELFSPDFYNYQYDLNSKNINVLLESDLYFKPIVKQITPVLTLGFGLGTEYTSYNDYALPGIFMDSERHWSTSRARAIYELGAGLIMPVSSSWAIKLRYGYFFKGKTNSPIVQFQNINMTLNNQTVFLGISYFL